MKHIQLLFLVLLTATNGFSQFNIEEENCEVISIGQFQELEDFGDIISKLKTENRLTISNASAIKLVSSDSYVAFEQTPDSIVNQHGKIDADDIELILQVTVNENKYLIIVTLYSSFGHAFKYGLSQKNLERIKNIGHVTLPRVGVIKVEGCNGPTVNLSVSNSPRETNKWIKYYLLDLSYNTFTNTRNCRITDAGEECKEMEKVEIFGVYSSQSCPMPPFAKVETEISNNRICIRNILPPRHKMNESHLEVYDLWDTTTKYREIEKTDFDSIANFILNSGLLQINFHYANPETDGPIAFKTGVCSYGYVIETSWGEIELPISDNRDYNVPDIVSEFNGLFYDILDKYFNEYEPEFDLYLKLREK